MNNYLDLKWIRLEEFARTSEGEIKEFITAVKRFLTKDDNDMESVETVL